MSYNPGAGPYNNPQITISTPLQAPPQQFTNIPTLIDGHFDGLGVLLFRNGILQTEGPDYSRNGGMITMVVPPRSGDIMTARLFTVGKQLGGNNPVRYVTPLTFRLEGSFDAVGTAYAIAFGPSIFGTLNGINNTFTWGVVLRRTQIFLNGVLQEFGYDVVAGPTAMTFLPVAIPQPGDIITMLGWG